MRGRIRVARGRIRVASEASMTRFIALFLTALTLVSAANTASAAQTWREGQHYTRLNQPQHTNVAPGKVEVLEVFSYGCPFCNTFQPVIRKLKQAMPPNAQMAYLPASFSASENWPLFQRAYFAAQSLGVAERAHEAMYDAVWKTGELAVIDPKTHLLKSQQASLEDVARCYGRLTGVKPEKFLATAKSFAVEMKMKAADAQVRAMQVPGTPCLVVNGKYRVNMDSLTSPDQVIDLVKYLISL
jgi:protein dithiol oxidoreductase (disulfide-forming)